MRVQTAALLAEADGRFVGRSGRAPLSCAYMDSRYFEQRTGTSAVRPDFGHFARPIAAPKAAVTGNGSETHQANARPCPWFRAAATGDESAHLRGRMGVWHLALLIAIAALVTIQMPTFQVMNGRQVQTKINCLRNDCYVRQVGRCSLPKSFIISGFPQVSNDAGGHIGATAGLLQDKL